MELDQVIAIDIQNLDSASLQSHSNCHLNHETLGGPINGLDVDESIRQHLFFKVIHDLFIQERYLSFKACLVDVLLLSEVLEILQSLWVNDCVSFARLLAHLHPLALLVDSCLVRFVRGLLQSGLQSRDLGFMEANEFTKRGDLSLNELELKLLLQGF